MRSPNSATRTGAIDIWVRLLKALEAFGFGSLGLTPGDFLKPESVVQLCYPPARIDLLTTIDGVQFDSCFRRKMPVSMDGVVLPIIDITDFRTNKLAAGRARDLADLESLDEPSEPLPEA